MNGKWKAIKEIGAYGLVLFCFYQLIQDQRSMTRQHAHCIEVLKEIRQELRDLRQEVRTGPIPPPSPERN